MIRAVWDKGHSYLIAFAAIWSALYASGTLKAVIPEWVGPEIRSISLPLTSAAPSPAAEAFVDEPQAVLFVPPAPDPDWWPLVGLLVLSLALAVPAGYIWNRSRG